MARVCRTSATARVCVDRCMSSRPTPHHRGGRRATERGCPFPSSTWASVGLLLPRLCIISQQNGGGQARSRLSYTRQLRPAARRSRGNCDTRREFGRRRRRGEDGAHPCPSVLTPRRLGRTSAMGGKVKRCEDFYTAPSVNSRRTRREFFSRSKRSSRTSQATSGRSARTRVEGAAMSLGALLGGRRVGRAEMTVWTT